VKYSVRWREEASDELATIWLKSESSERREITAAAGFMQIAPGAGPSEVLEP
jgi:hypothetical protein